MKLKTIKSYPIRESGDILKILLKDRTTRKNIIWATNSYQTKGEGYQAKDHIKETLFRNGAGQIIKPRVDKDNEEQSKRTRGKGEVFTPIWIIKKKVDLIEEELSKLDLEAYIGHRWLEITCGEAPYITSRYDTVTGEYLNIEERVGFLDRKLQRISKETSSEETWFYLALKAYQSSYGYEYQGDSLLIARENLLNSFIDYYVAKFNHVPKIEKMEEIARIISYNLFQIDGLKYTLPVVEKITAKKFDIQLSIFGDMEKEDQQLEMVVEEGEKVKVKNWLNDRMIKFKDLVKNEGRVGSMKFDVVIGNPPYQMEVKDTRAKQIYPEFMDSAYSIGDKVLLITPGRFLFNAGATSKKWNLKMLSDENLKVIDYRSNSTDFFSNVDIKGGVAITYRDRYKEFGAINLFIPREELNTILDKVSKDLNEGNLSDIVYTSVSYQLTPKFHSDNPKESSTLPKNRNMLTTNIFDKFPNIFLEDNPIDENKYIEIIGRKNNRRVSHWVKADYVQIVDNYNFWKVLLAKSNGSGELGESFSSPFIGEPKLGHTQTFISIGNFSTQQEARSCLKYIKTKFTRSLLGILKVTQDNPPRVWRKIPLQDFTSNSDIDWTKSISEIDQQLYKKYGLDEEEINFIESNVKEME